jgi:hypothetical protein
MTSYASRGNARANPTKFTGSQDPYSRGNSSISVGDGSVNSMTGRFGRAPPQLKIEFNDHRIDAVPEEGLSRLTTSHREIQSDSLQRYGLAVLLNTEHMGTPQGQEFFAFQMKQMMNATNESIAFGAAHHILSAIPYEDPTAKYMGTNSAGGTVLDNRFRAEARSFCCLS